MAATDNPFQQIETILHTVIHSPAFNGRGTSFTRSIQVTPKIKDIKISVGIVQVHPEWAVELGPLDAVAHILKMCDDFDRRRAEARALLHGALFHNLMQSIEACRVAGREDLISMALEASRPVPRSRSLVAL